MRRRKVSGRGDSQAAIFAAAAAEFARHGFDAARVDRIADAARVNKAMLYYHYGSKLGLYVGVVRDMLTAVGARSRAIADGPGTADRKLDAWIAAFVEEAAARPWMPSIMLREIASGAPHIDHETFAMMDGVFGAFRDVLAQGQREGAFRRVDPLLAYLTVLPSILIFFARQVVTRRRRVSDLAVGAPLSMEAFVLHVQTSARAMLRRES